MMKTNPWFRMYSDFMFDDKIEFLAFEDQRHYIVLLCMKNAGLLDKEYLQEGMLERVVAKRLGLLGETFESARKRLVEAGLIDMKFQPLAWDKRQFISDHDSTAADRKRRERARKSELTNGGTDMSRVTSQTSVTNVTALDTETDTDTEEEKDIVVFEQAWTAYPGRPGKSKANSLKAWNARLKSGCTSEEMLQGVINYAACCKAQRTEPGYIKQPETFFGPGLHFRSSWKTAPNKHQVPNIQPGDLRDIPDED